MMENSRPEEGYLINDVRNFLRWEKLTKETIDTTIKSIKILFRLEKENEVIKDRILREIRNVFRLGK